MTVRGESGKNKSSEIKRIKIRVYNNSGFFYIINMNKKKENEWQIK